MTKTGKRVCRDCIAELIRQIPLSLLVLLHTHLPAHRLSHPSLPLSHFTHAGFFGTGLFLEDRETSTKSAYKKIEEKKLLSSLESAGILSKLEKAGFTLTKIEQAGLLSTAENLGLLALAEDLLTANPATIASGSLPFIVASIGALAFIPHDNAVTSFVSYTLAASFAAVATAAVVGGFVVAAIQEE